MLTPIISFATTDDTDTDNTADTEVTDNTAGDDTTGDNTDNGAAAGDTSDGDADEKTWIDVLRSNAAIASSLPEEDILAEKAFLNLSFTERQKAAREKAIVAVSKEDIEGHSFVCANGGYELYLKQDNMSIIIRDEKSGAIMRSTLSPTEAVARGYTQAIYDTVTSGVLVQPIVFNTKAETNRFGQYSFSSAATPLLPEYVTVDELKEDGKVVGFTAHINFKNFGFEFDIIVKLNDEGILSWEIPESTMKETNKEYIMADLYVFPMFGYTDRGDRSGYMILPDGNGITVGYDDYFQYGEPKYKSAYLKNIYGSDIGYGVATGGNAAAAGDNIETSRDFTSSAEKVTIPYFGTVYTDTKLAMIGLVEEGEYGASIQGVINGVNRMFENYTSPKFTYRSLFVEYTDSVGSSERQKTTKNRVIGDVKVSYMLASGDDANYSGLANRLRDYLIEKGTLTESGDKEFNVRQDYLGVDKENFMVFRRNVVATTVDDIRDILGRMSKLGVTNVLAIYEGWQDDGVYNVPVTDFDADSDIGGNKAVKELSEELKKGGTVKFYLMQDMMTINTSLTSSVYTSINAYTGKTFERFDRFNEVFNTFRYLYPEKTKEYIKDLTDEFIEDDIKNVAFSEMGDTLFVYQKDKENYSRRDSMKQYTEALSEAKEKGMSILLENPYMYMWKYTDAYLDFTVGSSMYVYATDEIPFLSSVLKGIMPMYSEYINFEANSTEYFLKLVETGVYPSFLITKESPAVLQYTNSNWIYSSEYDKYEETIADYYHKLKEVNDKVEGEYIVKHEKLDSDVSITTYSNGVKVYVNFSDVDVTVDDMTIKAESYSVR